MKDDNKTKKQLIDELMELRSQNAELKGLESAEKYRSLVENIRDVIYELDSQGVVLYISPAVRDMLGFDAGEIVGKNFTGLVHKDDQSSLEEWFSELRKGREYSSEYRVCDKSGDLKWARTNTRPIIEDGQFRGARGILIDVTAQRRMVDTLKESEDRYRLVFENGKDIIYTIDTNLNFVSVSPSIERILGYKPQDFIGRPASDLTNILTPEAFEHAITNFSLILKGEATPARIYQCAAKDGTIKHLEVHGSTIMREGQIVGIISVARDITDRKRAANHIRRQTDAMEAAIDGIALLNEDEEYVYLNQAHVRIYGYKNAGELVGKSWKTLYDADELQRFDEEIMPKLRQEGYWQGEALGMKKDGSKFPQGLSLTALHDGGLICVIRDITDRKRAEESLQDSQELFSLFMRHSPVYTYIKEVTPTESRVLQASDNYDQMIGIPGPKMTGRTMTELFPQEFAEKITADDWAVVSSGNVLQLDEDLNGRNYVTIKFPIYQRGKKLLAGYTIDITERKQTERALSKSEEKYRNLFENANESIFVTQDGKLVFLNPMTTMMTGYSGQELMSRPFIEFIHPDDQGMVIDRHVRRLKGKEIPHNYSFRIIRKDGSIRWGELSAVLISWEGKPATLNFLNDITDRKRTDEALQESEKKYRDLYDFLPIPVYEMDFEANIKSVNRAVYEAFRGTEGDFKKGVNAWQILSPEDIDKSSKNIEGLLKGGKVEGTEYTLTRLDGSVFPAIIISSVIYSHDKPVGLRGAIIDITQRKQQEDALKESEEKYRLLADNVNDVIFVLDMNLNYTYVSPSVKILRGYEPEEVMKHSPEKTLTPSSWDKAVKTLSEVIELEKSGHREIFESRTIELEMWRKGGTTAWTEVKFSFIRDENQRPVGILGVTREITDRKEAEQKLKNTLKSLRRAVGTTIQVLVSAVETRDPYTSGHQTRSAGLARAIATEMGLTQDKIEGIRMAGSIHDIGKLSIPAEILSKPTKLSELEFALIKAHAQRGFEILKDVESPWPLAEIVYQHHERMDGSGYPRNLKGEEILIEARILSVADVVEAMASHRPYRAGLGINAALNEIEKNSGTLYDDAVADACLRLFHEEGYKFD
jgi:PAS domain S-box-containing protein